MDEEPEHDQVLVDLRIERTDRAGQAHQVERVLEQPAQVRVVHALGRRRDAEAVHQVFVGEVRLGERLHRWVLKLTEDLLHLGEHLAHVLVRRGQELHELLGRGFERVDLVDDQLHLALVGLRLALDPDEPLDGESGERGLVERPRAGRDLARLVAQQAAQIRLVVPCAPKLGVGDRKSPAHAFLRT